jgi:hypothetical protein
MHKKRRSSAALQNVSGKVRRDSRLRFGVRRCSGALKLIRTSLPNRRRCWCRRCFSFHWTDFDRPGHERSVSVLHIGAAHLVVVVDIFDGRCLPAFGYGSAVNDSQNMRFPFPLDRECLRVFVDGGNHSMIWDEQSSLFVIDGGTVRRRVRRGTRRLGDYLSAEQYAERKHQHGAEEVGWGPHKLGWMVRAITAVSTVSQAASLQLTASRVLYSATNALRN